MPRYVILCPSCSAEFLSYEKYVSHVFERHEDQPSLRMQAKIIKKETYSADSNSNKNWEWIKKGLVSQTSYRYYLFFEGPVVALTPITPFGD